MAIYILIYSFFRLFDDGGSGTDRFPVLLWKMRLLFLLVSAVELTDSLSLVPPSLRSTSDLRRDCEALSPGLFRYDEAKKPWAMASAIFDAASCDGSVDVWLPRDDGTATKIAKLIDANVETWPKTPATRVTVQGRPVGDFPAGDAEEAMFRWVDEVLGRRQLCPHVKSKDRAATGVAGIQEGPVRVVVAPGRLVDTVFKELCDLETSDVATVLVVDPLLDDDCPAFLRLCDDLIEPAIQITGATSVIGRAWFHPSYGITYPDTTTTEIRPGHAIPPALAVDFFRRYYPQHTDADDERIAQANVRIRHTPHATVNLLRREHLVAAKQQEDASPSKRPNSIYARNVARLLDLD